MSRFFVPFFKYLAPIVYAPARFISMVKSNSKGIISLRRKWQSMSGNMVEICRLMDTLKRDLEVANERIQYLEHKLDIVNRANMSHQILGNANLKLVSGKSMGAQQPSLPSLSDEESDLYKK